MTTSISTNTTYRTLIIGAGPAGTGPLIGALQRGQFQALLDSQIAILDRTATMGRGLIGQYTINSDTVGATLLECLRPTTQEVFASVLDAEPTRQIEALRHGAVPLQVVGEYMALLGASLQQQIEAHPSSCFQAHSTATSVWQQPDGSYQTHIQCTLNGRMEQQIIQSETVIWAMGASQSRKQTLAAELVAGLDLQAYDSKVLLTSHVLTAAGVAEIEQRLHGIKRPRVVIIGGSHSAFSSAWTLLNKLHCISFSHGDITILHRDALRLFYPSREAALAEGYTDFTDADFCPITKRLYRLAGFRLDSRELLMRIWGMRGSDIEQRVALRPLNPATDDPATITALLDQADLIIPAFGYRPHSLPIYDKQGKPIALFAQQAGAAPLVDTACCVLNSHGEPILGLYGIGLASGFKLTGALGGEPSFRGQTNGLWLYQNGVGEIILDQLFERIGSRSVEV
jgi:hypothetical protein